MVRGELTTLIPRIADIPLLDIRHQAPNDTARTDSGSPLDEVIRRFLADDASPISPFSSYI